MRRLIGFTVPDSNKKNVGNTPKAEKNNIQIIFYGFIHHCLRLTI
jgi:hypothetical protein